MILYYTDNTHNPLIEDLCRQQLLKANLPIVSVSLNKDIDFGDKRIRMDGKRSPEMMLKQITAGLEECEGYTYLAENDVLYHPSHFDFTPREDKFYFNTNVWKWKWGTDLCVWTDDLQQLSGMSGYKGLLLDYFRNKEANRHYEPKENTVNYQSTHPNIDIRHDRNITKSKWSPQDFRNKKYAKGFKTAYMKKTIANLIDELSITNIKLWHLEEKVALNTHTKEDAKKIQDLNRYRAELMNALSEEFNQQGIIKMYGA